MNNLALFESVASPDEFRMLAHAADTSAQYLRNLARGYVKRAVSVRLALRVEKVSKSMRAKNRKLPVVSCQDLADLAEG